MATTKMRQDSELSEKIFDDVSGKNKGVMTLQSTESFSPNQMQKIIFSHESTKQSENSENSNTSSNDSSKNFHDNQHEGVSMVTNTSQLNSSNLITNLFIGPHRQ